MSWTSMKNSRSYLKADTKRRDYNDPYAEIAAAAVRQAVNDWVELHKKRGKPEWLRDPPGTKKENRRTKADEIRNIEEFFLSEDFQMYTDIDGKKLLEYLKDLYLLRRVV